MLSKFHKNAILTGYIDSYCLACESHLRSDEDINVHISKPIHVKNLDATGFLEKYKEDCVRKVKKGYYCEFCNLLLSTAAKVGLHIGEEKHVNSKGTQLLRRVGSVILAFDNVLINERAWHGLIDETCTICNNEFNDESIHKTEPTHILNLVQSKVEFGSDKNIYRKIDDSSFQCLTCNVVLSLNAITTHFKEQEHKQLYQDCNQAYVQLNLSQTVNVPIESQKEIPKVSIEQKVTAPKVTEKPEPKPNPKVVEKSSQENVKQVTETVKKTDTVQNVKKQEAAKKTATTQVSKKENGAEAKHSQRPKMEKVSPDLDDEICKALNAKDYITRDEKGQQWCLLCDWTMDAAVIHIHVNGRHHQTMLKMHRERMENKKKLQDNSSCIDESEAKLQKQEINKAEQEEKLKILDSVSTFQKNDININFETDTAMCKKCSKNVDFIYKSIEAHIEEHKKNAPQKESVKLTSVTNEKPSSVSGTNAKTTPLKSTPVKSALAATSNAKTDEPKKTQPAKNDEEKVEARASSASSNRDDHDDIEKFVKEHDLTYSKESNRVYCRVCNSRIPPSLNNMKEHVNGSSHKNKAAKALERIQNKPSIVKRPTKDFIKKFVIVENAIMKDVILNENLCLNIFSFMMISLPLERRGQMRCQACEVNVRGDQVEMHRTSPSHIKAMAETPVILSIESEFIREIRPNIYHCGFCNIVESKEDMPHHLNSTAHREAKTSSNWRLQQYLPELMMQQRQEQLGMYLLLRMLAEQF